jgi:hypothetical protein
MFLYLDAKVRWAIIRVLLTRIIYDPILAYCNLISLCKIKQKRNENWGLPNSVEHYSYIAFYEYVTQFGLLRWSFYIMTQNLESRLKMMRMIMKTWKKIPDSRHSRIKLVEWDQRYNVSVLKKNCVGIFSLGMYDKSLSWI